MNSIELNWIDWNWMELNWNKKHWAEFFRLPIITDHYWWLEISSNHFRSIQCNSDRFRAIAILNWIELNWIGLAWNDWIDFLIAVLDYNWANFYWHWLLTIAYWPLTVAHIRHWPLTIDRVTSTSTQPLLFNCSIVVPRNCCR